MDEHAVMAASATPILEIGRAWMADPATAARGQELGLAPGFGFWVNGRAGAIGQPEAEVAAAAIGFMEPSMVRRLWSERPASLSPRQAALAYAEAAATWGRAVLASVPDDDLIELESLARRVADAAKPSVGVLFAAWRELPVPDDPAGAVTVTLNVLRELRGGAHLSAVQAAGIGPVGAIVAAPDPVRGGPAGAERFGWAGPYPEADRDARSEAERLTSVICRPAYAALGSEEGSRFVELIQSVRSAMD